jgi:hypothetical protein
MAKLTTAQAYAAQVKADRRAAALERLTTAAGADERRVRELYAGATETLTPDGRKRFDVLGRNNEQKRGPVAKTSETGAYKVTRLPGGLKASLASEKAAATRRARRFGA